MDTARLEHLRLSRFAFTATIALAGFASIATACGTDRSEGAPALPPGEKPAPADGATPDGSAESGGTRFNLAGRYAGVFVFPSSTAGGAGTVLAPDGSKIDTSGTETAGLQEAIQYAVDYGWDLFIYGRGPEAATSTYSLAKGLRFPAIQGKTIRIVDAVLDFPTLTTEPAIQFDSTMMVDFRMTGAIQAPHAPSGIFFHPVALSPLDGVINGAKGVVDSRFHFESVSAQTKGVFFDTTTAGVNNTQFYFGSITVAAGGKKIDHVGTLFSQSILDTADQAQVGSPNLIDALDYYEPSGVVVIPPLGSIGEPGTVYLPDGTLLPVTGTQTAGLQEAIDYAGSHQMDLVVYGRGLQHKFIAFDGGTPSYPTNGFFQINKGLKFGPLKNKAIRMYNVTLNYGSVTSEPAFEFGAAEDVDVEITGQLVAVGSPVCFMFNAESGEITRSRFRIGHFMTGNGVGVMFDPTKHDIKNNRFSFGEVLENAFGIRVRAPSADTCFCDNYVRGLHVHSVSQVGVQIGEQPANAGLITRNTFDVMVDPDSRVPDVGVQVWGQNNAVFASVRGSGATKRGISFEPTSTGNSVTYNEMRAVTPIFAATPGANTASLSNGPLFGGN